MSLCKMRVIVRAESGRIPPTYSNPCDCAYNARTPVVATENPTDNICRFAKTDISPNDAPDFRAPHQIYRCAATFASDFTTVGSDSTRLLYDAAENHRVRYCFCAVNSR